MLFLGPFDLSAALGRMGEPDHPEVRTRIEQVEQAAKATGKHLGGIPTPGRTAEALFAAGYDLVLADFDVLLLRDAARSSVAARCHGPEERRLGRKLGFPWTAERRLATAWRRAAMVGFMIARGESPCRNPHQNLL